MWTPASGPQLPFDFSYDGFDNLVATNTKTLSYNHVDNKLTGYLDASVAKSVEYDGAGRAREIASAAEMETYAYNTDNLTAAYTDAAGGSTYYRYGYTNLLTTRETSDGGLQIYGYRRANPGLPSWVLTAEGFSDNPMMGAYTPVAAFAPGGEYYYLTDDDSSRVLAVADATGQAYVPHDDPYGQEIANPNAPQKLGVPEFQPLFAGQLRISGEPHVYNHHRFYRPDLGRYLAPDPIKTPGGNMYAYAEGNPVSLVDPDGREVAEGRTLCRDQDSLPTVVCGSLATGCAHAYSGKGRDYLSKNMDMESWECFAGVCDGDYCIDCDYWCLQADADRSNTINTLQYAEPQSDAQTIALDMIRKAGCDESTGAHVTPFNVISDNGEVDRNHVLVVYMYKTGWIKGRGHKCGVDQREKVVDPALRLDLATGRALAHEIAHCCDWKIPCPTARHANPWTEDPCKARPW